MGIKGLWAVVAPFSEKKSLHEIRGETLAIDLSGWVCDSQNVTDYHIQPKLYLRNLFFRTVYLILADVVPIFVLEGDAPDLKRDVMAARNAIQFRGTVPRSEMAITNKRPDVARKRFRNVLKECETLLKSMGVICVKGRGEAEATCAQLNAQGMVDAVISQDSDCFAYGARRVYRNFSVSSAAGGGAMQGSVDCYDADKMFQNNGFGRNKMVALALLCGCDYGVGACGSSITTVTAYLHTIPDQDIIPRLVSWVSDPERYEEQNRWASLPGRCDRCGHAGRTHVKNGCPMCGSNKGCEDLGHKSKVAAVKRELSLRSRALSCGMPFPEPKVMMEFLNAEPEVIDVDSLRKIAPNLIQFVKLMSCKLDWSERYCVQKFLPLLTKWHLQENVTGKTIKPIKIKKKRIPKGVPSYEVIWADIDDHYGALISDDQFAEGEDRSAVWTSIERQDLLRHHYPDLVHEFEESIKKPAKEKKSSNKKSKTEKVVESKPKRKYNRKVKNDNVNLSISSKNIDVSQRINSSKVGVKVNTLKRKLKNQSANRGQKTLRSFIANKKRKSIKLSSIDFLRTSFENMSIDQEKHDMTYKSFVKSKDNHLEKNDANNKSKHLLSMFNATDDNISACELSNIIENIVTKAPVMKTAKLDRNLVKLLFNYNHSTPSKPRTGKNMLENDRYSCSTPKESPLRDTINKSHRDISNRNLNFKENVSNFFDKFSEEGDAFEQSLDCLTRGGRMECDNTLDFSLPVVTL